jgi:hypothetical protein
MGKFLDRQRGKRISLLQFLQNKEIRLKIPDPIAANVRVPKDESHYTQYSIYFVDSHRLSKWKCNSVQMFRRFNHTETA